VQYKVKNVLVSPTGHFSGADSSNIAGHLIVTEDIRGDLILRWIADKSSNPLLSNYPSQEIYPSSSIFSENNAKIPMETAYNINVSLKDVRAIKKVVPTLGTPYIIIQTKTGVAYPPLFFYGGGLRDFFQFLSSIVTLSKSPADRNVFLLHDKKTQLLQGIAIDQTDFTNSISYQTSTKNVEESVLASSVKERPRNHEENFRTPVHVHSNIGDFEIVETDKQKIEPEPLRAREKPLTESEWLAAFDHNGRIKNIDQIKQRIFWGGVEPNLRNRVWKFLLGYFPWDSTENERLKLQEQKRQEYLVYKQQWNLITKEQESKFRKFRSRKYIIDADVQRTDREHPLLLHNDSPLLKKNYDILLSYSFYNFDLGYVQGMSDMLSPISLTLDDEADAFWCFKGHMDLVESCFHKDKNGIQRQLDELDHILRVLDPSLRANFRSASEEKETGLLCCYRWLLVRFKREFSLVDTSRIWEVLWTQYPTPSFHLFVAAAILISHREEIMNLKSSDDLFVYLNELAGHLDCERILQYAEALYRTFDKATL